VAIKGQTVLLALMVQPVLLEQTEHPVLQIVSLSVLLRQEPQVLRLLLVLRELRLAKR
jgi:hypothetical protein